MHHLIETQIDRLIAVCCPLDIYMKYQTYRDTDSCTNIFLQTRAFLTAGMGESPTNQKFAHSPPPRNPPPPRNFYFPPPKVNSPPPINNNFQVKIL